MVGGEVEPSGVRPSRRARLLIRAGLGLTLVVALGVALVLALTPSAGSAAARARAWAAAHHVGPPLTTPPARIAAALIATEDHRFYQHHGLDVVALGRAAGGLVSGRDSGGSTIEVQLAKLLFTGGRDGPADQTEQAALAVKLDLAYTKTQILLMYLNSEYFGHGFYGVTAAAHGYFNTEPQDVTWDQAATLVGLLKAPSYDDPLLHPDRALGRRGEVVDRLRSDGDLTVAEAAAIDATPLHLPSSGSGVAAAGSIGGPHS
jgi:penicillin-binding protein 1A